MISQLDFVFVQNHAALTMDGCASAGNRIKVSEVPLAVVEITPPNQPFNELTDKARQYFEHGVQSCWLVLLPLTTICVFSSVTDYTYFRAHETLEDPALGITLPLKEVFE